MADPITMGLTAVGGLLSSLIGSGNAPPTPAAPPPPPAPIQSPTGTPSTNKPAGGSSFLSQAAAPPQNQTGGHTLLGQ